jgi:hypothetical protein
MNQDGPTHPLLGWDKDAEERGAVEAHQVLDAISPWSCIMCPGIKHVPGVNTICTACEERLHTDDALRFLHERTLEIYKFWIDLTCRTLSDKFFALVLKGNHYIWVETGIPGVQTRAWMPRDGILWCKENDTDPSRAIYLDQLSAQLFEQAQLTSNQCHIAVVMLAELMEQRIQDWPGSPVEEVEEIYFKPEHETCTDHWTFRVRLTDGRRFAVNFADRQLGWLPIVVPWRLYLRERVLLSDTGKQILNGEAAGTSYDEGPGVIGANDHDAMEARHSQEDGELAVMVAPGILRWKKDVHREEYLGINDWGYEDENMTQDLPACDLVFEHPPLDWRPNTALSDKEKFFLTNTFKCVLEENVFEYFARWKAGDWPYIW